MIAVYVLVPLAAIVIVIIIVIVCKRSSKLQSFQCRLCQEFNFL